MMRTAWFRQGNSQRVKVLIVGEKANNYRIRMTAPTHIGDRLLRAGNVAIVPKTRVHEER